MVTSRHWYVGWAALLLALSVPRIGVTAEFPTATPAHVGFSAERLARLDEYMKRHVGSDHVPGAITLLARHGKIVAFNSYGEADPDRHVAMKKDAIFRIYSQSKVVTAVAMMMLFEEGQWRFSDPITRFLPELGSLRVFKELNPDGSMQLEDVSRPPTLRELLTHSAGFGYGLSESNPVDAAYSQSNFMHSASTAEAIRKIAQLPLASQPGLHWRYSAAVDIQGYLIERLSGLSLRDFLQKRIFGPLKMRDTDFYVPSSKWSRFAALKSYDTATKALGEPGGVLNFDFSRPPGVASAGAGLVSTASDYLRFAQMLLNGGELDGVRILAPSTVRLLASNHLADDIRVRGHESFSTQSGYGFGINVLVIEDPAKAESPQGAGTFAWSGAAGTWFWIDPKNDLVFIGMTQVMNRDQDPQSRNIDHDSMAMVYGALVDPGK